MKSCLLIGAGIAILLSPFLVSFGPLAIPAAAQEPLETAAITADSMPPLPRDATIQELTEAQYAGAVSAAMQAMELVVGEMSAAERKQFEQEWYPLFEYPCQEVVDYLNQLNPLLDSFLSIRSAMQETANEFDAAWNEAVACGMIEYEDGIREALAVARLKEQTLRGLSLRMEEVVEAIGALGPPPDVLAIKAEAMRRHRAARRALDPGPSSPLDGEWVGFWKTETTSDEKGAFANTFEGLAKVFEDIAEAERERNIDEPDQFTCHLQLTAVDLANAELDDDQLMLHVYNYDDMGLMKLEVDPRLAGQENECDNWFTNNRNLILPPLTKIDEGHYRLEYFSRYSTDWLEKWIWDFELEGEELTITEKGHYRLWGAEHFDRQEFAGWAKPGALRSHRSVTLRRKPRVPGLASPADFSIDSAAMPKTVPEAAWVLQEVKIEPAKDTLMKINIDPRRGTATESGNFNVYDPRQEKSVIDTVTYEYRWTPLPERMKREEVIDVEYSVTKTSGSIEGSTQSAATRMVVSDLGRYEWEPSQEVTSDGRRQLRRSLFLPSQPFIEKGQDVVVVYLGFAQVQYWYTRVPAEVVEDVVVAPLPAQTRPEVDQLDAERMAQKQESIAFHRDCIRIIEHNLERDREDLNRTTDPDRRGELISRMMNNQHNLHSEMDRIREIETGEIIHTRTPVDAYYKMRWEQSIIAHAQEIKRAHKLYEGVQRLAGLAPEDQRADLRAFIDRQCDPGIAVRGDTQTLQRVVDAVANRVQGHWEGEAARSLEKSLEAADYLKRLEGVQSWSEFALTAYTFGYGGHGLMMGFQAGTGFAVTEGPISHRAYEATKRGLAWYNQATYVASEAMVGYEKGGWFGDNKGSVLGAVERAGEAFLLMKGFEFAAGKIFGVQPPLDKKAYVKQRFELARRQQAIEDGVSLVDDYQRAYNDYQRALEFGAGSAEIQAMEEQLRRKAASIHANFESKLFLKRVGSDPRFSPLITDFNQRMGQVHAQVRDRFREVMRDNQYQHVDDWLLQEFRNSSSLGAINMDHDIGVLDRVAGGPLGERSITFVKNNVRVSPIRFQQDAQRAWEQAYQRTTGYSAKQSFEELTTRAVHPEAYRDLSWLGDSTLRRADVGNIVGAYAPQAGDVTAFKASSLFSNSSLQPLQRVVEVSRGTVKDINSKLLPVLEEAARKVMATNSSRAMQIDQHRKHWQRISEILADAADDPIGVDRRLRQLTGDRGLPEVVADFRDMIANYGKFIGQ